MPAPEFLGRYAVRRALGAGGFAVVWLGYDDRLDDEVAIKVLAENFAHRLDIHDRFLQEARVLRRTRSQHVVEVYDVDELPDGRPYFVMTYADGGSLADLLTEGPLPVDEALRIGADTARGVQDLHEASVLHRDIKPSNVLFRTAADGSRTVLVADLGLSRELAKGSRITLTAGTPGFMPPEQATNSGADHRADVYGIGATIYTGLTGHEPPADGPAPRPSTVRPELPPAVDDVLLRAMAADPDDRWPTARALGDALDELRGSAQGPPTRRRMRTTLAVVAGTVAIAAAGTTWLAAPDRSAPPESRSAPSPAADEPPPGTRVPCATANGRTYDECFVHARGDTGFLLDFYSHNHEVVLWELKPDDDTYAYSQRWRFLRLDTGAYLVHNEHTNRCLALDSGGEAGAPLRVAACDPADPGQLWTSAGEVFRSKHGTCLDVPRGEYRMGATPFAYDCHGGLNQQWVTRPAQ